MFLTEPSIHWIGKIGGAVVFEHGGSRGSRDWRSTGEGHGAPLFMNTEDAEDAEGQAHAESMEGPG